MNATTGYYDDVTRAYDLSHPGLEPYLLEGSSAENPRVHCGTRSGTKVHVSSPGSSVTGCGTWLRTDCMRFAVRRDRIQPGSLCRSCFTDEYIRKFDVFVAEPNSIAAGARETEVLLDEERRELKAHVRGLEAVAAAIGIYREREAAFYGKEAELQDYLLGDTTDEGLYLSLRTGRGVCRANRDKALTQAWDAVADCNVPTDRGLTAGWDSGYDLDGIGTRVAKALHDVKSRLAEREDEIRNK